MNNQNGTIINHKEYDDSKEIKVAYYSKRIKDNDWINVQMTINGIAKTCARKREIRSNRII